ncbi:ABC transporter substrate-binding protein [Streptomyces boluensis]|uniref:Peptide-binding protein n=1 Tax=Streptomyces boluensis TaxID=1775135 RepID=A0A964UVB5_9ACTN|nr:ABC transporter substrate-binding protein [Streptomyces boluensis]NBE55040.1 peptide-binding protein [Streptomyces boluensis]
MFNRTRSLQAAATLASISLLSGCGLVSSDSSDEEKPIVVGTTSAPSTLDPAAAWDGSWELYRNVYQTLVSYPTGASTPEPDAAEACEFADESNTTYHCKLREGLRFSDGDVLDAKAVKHSIDRIKKIGVEGGPEGLLGSLDRIETSGDRDVTFHLKKADATFPMVLATPAMSIVDPQEYPADRLRTGDKITGSGPYLLDSYKSDKTAELTKNPEYKGFAERKNNAVTIRYFQDSTAMVKALKKKQIDVTFRGLTSQDVVDLQGRNARDEGLQLVEGAGTETRFLVFNPKDQWTKNPAVREAVAQVIDRGAIAHNIYKDTVEPLYSMVPTGVAGHTTGFFDTYGKPSTAKAKRILDGAGISGPVPLTLWYATDRYGSVTKPEFEEIKRQLEASKLFDVTLQGRPWKQFEEGFREGEYPVFGRGWFPDFPDPENFIAPFVGEHNNLGTPYASPRITDQLLPQSRRESDRGAVAEEFEKAQEILVEDARLLPLWQGKQYVAASEEIAGGERALDPSTIMTMWELNRKTSW